MMKHLFILLFTCLLLTSCGGQSYDYHSSNESKEGHGLLSGDDGEIYLIRAKKKEAESEEETTATEADEPKKEE